LNTSLGLLKEIETYTSQILTRHTSRGLDLGKKSERKLSEERDLSRIGGLKRRTQEKHLEGRSEIGQKEECLDCIKRGSRCWGPNCEKEARVGTGRPSG